MKFFLDANLPYSLKEIFREYGMTWHIRDVHFQTASDEEVFNLAVNKRAILVTKDREFGNPYLYPPQSHYGIIIVRLPHNFKVNQIRKTLKDFLKSIAKLELQRKVCIVEPGRFRIRK